MFDVWCDTCNGYIVLDTGHALALALADSHYAESGHAGFDLDFAD